MLEPKTIARKPIPRWFDPKEVRPRLKMPEPKAHAKPRPPQQYQVREDHDQGFTPCWRAEPVNYDGHGIVYLFDTEAEAIEKAKQKNKEFARERK